MKDVSPKATGTSMREGGSTWGTSGGGQGQQRQLPVLGCGEPN